MVNNFKTQENVAGQIPAHLENRTGANNRDAGFIISSPMVLLDLFLQTENIKQYTCILLVTCFVRFILDRSNEKSIHDNFCSYLVTYMYWY